MELAAKICIFIAITFTLVLLTIVALKMRSTLIAKHVIRSARSGSESSELTWRLLCACVPRNSLLRHVRVPMVTAPQLRVASRGGGDFYAPMPQQHHRRYCGVDFIVVGRGGITVIAASGMRGYIENPMRGDWRQFLRGEARQFSNPFEQCAIRQRAIRAALRREGMSNVPIQSLLVFTDPDVRFKNRFSIVISPERLAPVVTDINRNHFLASAEIKSAVRILRSLK